MKGERHTCEQCGKDYGHYEDGRGGDIAPRFCRVCSCVSNQDIDRGKPKNFARYVSIICPHFLGAKA